MERLKVWEWGEETASIKRDKKREKRVASPAPAQLKVWKGGKRRKRGKRGVEGLEVQTADRLECNKKAEN